jgi:hypothetical protein
MDKIMDFILCTGMTIFELAIMFIAVMLIQLIVYRTTGISLFNKFIRLMFKADKYLTAKFN